MMLSSKALGSENVPTLPAAASGALWPRVTIPAPGCGVDSLGLPGAKASPAVARLSLLAIVLWTMFTLTASCIEMPPPARPATLLTIMLLKNIHRVPLRRLVLVVRRSIVRVGCDILAIDGGQANPAAVAGTGRVALDEVGVQR